MYKIVEDDQKLYIRNRLSIGLFWVILLVFVLVLSFYQGFEYISISCDRTQKVNVEEETQTTRGKKKKRQPPKLQAKSPCIITHFDFKNGFQTDSIFLEEIIRMDRGYFSSVEGETKNLEIHYNPTFVTKQNERYPLRRISSVALTEEKISKRFNDFILKNEPRVAISDFYMGWWGVSTGIAVSALLFIILTGRYQTISFDKQQLTYSIRNYDFLGVKFSEGKWTDISRIIYQKEDTFKQKKGIYFVLNDGSVVYLTHHIADEYKNLGKRIADLIRHVVKKDVKMD